jgi:vacuolar-type H+-ATPase subunit I/STV1
MVSLSRFDIVALAAVVLSLYTFAYQDDSNVRVRFKDTPPRVQEAIRRELGDPNQRIKEMNRRIEDEKRLIKEEQQKIEQVKREMEEIKRTGKVSKQRMMEINQRFQESTRKINEGDRRIEITEREIEETRRDLEEPRMDIKWRMRNGKPAYELDMRLRGRNVELFISEDGRLLRRREEIEQKELPKSVWETLRREAGEPDFERMIRGVVRYTENKSVWYEVGVGRRKGRPEMTFWIMGDGKLLNKREN